VLFLQRMYDNNENSCFKDAFIFVLKSLLSILIFLLLVIPWFATIIICVFIILLGFVLDVILPCCCPCIKCVEYISKNSIRLLFFCYSLPFKIINKFIWNGEFEDDDDDTESIKRLIFVYENK